MSISSRYTPYRRKLLWIFSTLLLLVALLVLPWELYRPLDRLNQLSGRAKLLITGLQASFAYDELKRLNRFALLAMQRVDQQPPTESAYLGAAFTMLVQEGRVLPASQAEPKLNDMIPGYQHQQLESAARFWQQLFAEQEAILPLLYRYKQLLTLTKMRTIDSGYRIGDLYIMVDSGKQEGAFTDQIIFLLDGLNWWQRPAYAGQHYDTSKIPDWRGSALAGRSEFAANPLRDPDNFYLPRFDKDAWGTWYSVWRTEKVAELYNLITVDLEASDVTDMMLTVLLLVLAVFLLVVVAVFAIAVVFSHYLTRPVAELTRGAEAVMAGDYHYRVERFNNDELGELTEVFNRMIASQQERLNLKRTLEKLLSEELAERAGQQGMILGGQHSECSIMFTDFADFSALARQITAEESVALLNLYFEHLIAIIKEFGGFPDKYIGDAIVAIFGAPIALEDHAERAVRCAIRMQQRMRELNRDRKSQGLPVLEMRIGLNSGEVLVGAIGCDMKLEYTSIGETTNLANRMESLCPIGHLAISEATWQRLDIARFMDVALDEVPQRLAVKGYLEPLAVYRLFVDYQRIDKVESPSVNHFYHYQSLQPQG